MTIKNFFSYAIVATAMFAFAGTAAAQVTDADASLSINATLETAITLEISDNVSGVDGTGTPSAFVVDLGSIDGLGLGTPATGVSVSAVSGGAIWTTPVDITATFSGLSETEDAVVTVSRGTVGDESLAVEGASAATVSGIANPDQMVNLSATSGVAFQRYVGFAIPRTQEAGALAAQLIYTVTIENN